MLERKFERPPIYKLKKKKKQQLSVNNNVSPGSCTTFQNSSLYAALKSAVNLLSSKLIIYDKK